MDRLKAFSAVLLIYICAFSSCQIGEGAINSNEVINPNKGDTNSSKDTPKSTNSIRKCSIIFESYFKNDEILIFTDDTTVVHEFITTDPSVGAAFYYPINSWTKKVSITCNGLSILNDKLDESEGCFYRISKEDGRVQIIHDFQEHIYK